MICPNCGNESTNNDIYCKHCGYEFQEKDFAENYNESSISEEIPSKKTVSISEPSFPEEVPFDEALKGNIPISFDPKNQINNILDKDQQKKVSMESSISEEIPSDTDEADTSTSASFNEEVPFESALKGNIPKNESDISSEISDKEAKKSPIKNMAKEEASSPKKEKKSNAVLIIILLLLGCVLLYFGIQYIQTGNIFPLSTAQPQTTATSQISSNKSDYSANIVETVINDKTYYSLIVYGKKGSTITIDNTKTYSLQGVSISIPIEPSDYTANSQVSNGMVAATIKVKIVGPDNEITTLSIPYNLKVESASTQVVK